MEVSDRKINRYILPAIIVLLILSLPAVLSGDDISIEETLFIVIPWIIIETLYLLFISTIGKLIKSDLISILLNLGLAFLLTGFLFRIQHWPFSGMLSLSGAVLILATTIFILLDKPGNLKNNTPSQ